MARYIWRAAFAQRSGIASIQLKLPQLKLATRVLGTETVLTQLKYTMAFFLVSYLMATRALGVLLGKDTTLTSYSTAVLVS